MDHSIPEIPVVYFHSIGPLNKSWTKNYLTVRQNEAEEFFKYVSRRYTSITIREYYQLKTSGFQGIKNPLLITIDDGYLDNWLFGFPLFKKYSLKATIFVAPEFVDKRRIIRKDLNEKGFLSWEEMKEMETSGVVDIQSHTLTHTKYFVSDRLTGFHHPGNDITYAAGNLFPEKKPYYFTDSGFEKLIPYGYPLFEEKSSVIARKVLINPRFIEEVLSELSMFDFVDYRFPEAFQRVKRIYDSFKTRNEIISNQETEDEYRKRIWQEIIESKRIIESELNKKVEFLCWPHGDNNSELHDMALQAGYLMTTQGKASLRTMECDHRIAERMGVNYSSYYKKQRIKLKLKALSGKFPYRMLMKRRGFVAE